MYNTLFTLPYIIWFSINSVPFPVQFFPYHFDKLLCMLFEIKAALIPTTKHPNYRVRHSDNETRGGGAYGI